ncbi:MAG: DNA-processing protein DprA, partial [Myxococcales bacterium]|nr:DNA-processing protein DprA [Myxococcales bacterium]
MGRGDARRGRRRGGRDPTVDQRDHARVPARSARADARGVRDEGGADRSRGPHRLRAEAPHAAREPRLRVHRSRQRPRPRDRLGDHRLRERKRSARPRARRRRPHARQSRGRPRDRERPADVGCCVRARSAPRAAHRRHRSQRSREHGDDALRGRRTRESGCAGSVRKGGAGDRAALRATEGLPGPRDAPVPDRSHAPASPPPSGGRTRGSVLDSASASEGRAPDAEASAPLDPTDSRPHRRAELLAWLRLQAALGLRPVDAIEGLRAGHAPDTLWRLADAAGRARALRVREGGSAWRALVRHRVCAVPWSSPAYPARLRPLRDAPPLLLVQGDCAAWRRPCVAIVGARAATGYGRGVARELAR